MNILILEDNEERIKWFKSAFAEHKLVITKIANVAIELLRKRKYDIIFLDHDLGGKINSEINTGNKVAKIISVTINKNTLVIVHSWNIVAAERMISLIGKNVIHIRFGQFDKHILERIRA